MTKRNQAAEATELEVIEQQVETPEAEPQGFDALIKDGFVKPIQLAKFINRPPQMVYTYVKKEYIASELDEDGKIVLPAESTREWVESFTTKQAERAAKRQAQLEAELAGNTDEA